MAELVDASGGMGDGLAMISPLFCLLALGLYALLQGRPENDDDDSGPGGGLMQPVA